MSSSKGRVGGAGNRRPGATDTTMLIWKTIDASPGITRDEIFAKVERQIPAGWAKRRYARYIKSRSTRADDQSAVDLAKARHWVLGEQLHAMKYYGSITRDSTSRIGGGYKTERPIERYQGDPGAIDETGTKAAEHLDYAYALRTAEAAVVRVNANIPRPTRAEWAAILKVIKRARSS